MDLASRKVDSASHMKMAVNLTSWMNNLASPMKIVVDSTSWMNNSASPMKIVVDSTGWMNNSTSRLRFPQFMYVCHHRVARRKLDEWPWGFDHKPKDLDESLR